MNARARYTVKMECQHQRHTEFPPLGSTYPCEQCNLSRAIESVTDARTGFRAIADHARQALVDARMEEIARTVDELRQRDGGQP